MGKIVVADYYDAHERHWLDAQQLFQSNRLANADHLYGMAAECGLKRLMLAFGMQFDTNKDYPTDGKDRVHANKTWARYETYRGGHISGSSYPLASINPFADWDVSQRYEKQSTFNMACVTKHSHGAAQVSRLVKQAKLAGLI